MPLVMPRWLRYLLPAQVVDAMRRGLWSLPDLRRTLRSGVRIQVGSPSDWTIYHEIFVDGEYDPALDRLVASRDPNDRIRVLDLGANVGYFTLRVADRLLRRPTPDAGWEVTMVEASGRLVGEIERRVSSQPLLADRVRVVHGLVGRREGVGVLREKECHFSHTVTEVGDAVRGTKVPYVDLETLFPEGSTIDLLKCDVEGSELVVLETYADMLERVQILVIELHHDLCDTERCLEILRGAGFTYEERLMEDLNVSLMLYGR